MTESLLELRARLQPVIRQPRRRQLKAGTPVVVPISKVDPAAKMLVVDNLETEKTYVTVPVEKAELEASDFLLKLRGRLVGEGTNLNGASWEAQDLDFGLPSVATGPLNWLHNERHIIGCLTDARMRTREAAAEAGLPDLGQHIEADAVVWRYIFPREAAAVEMAAGDRKLYYSMECISNEVQCVGPNGCGAKMGYLDSLHRTEKACVHVRERASARRFVQPIFQGGAVIVPPKSPGWANANVDVLREAARLMPEAAGLSNGDDVVAAQILRFVREGALG